MKTKSLNSNLHDANKAKKDEFYTQLSDIEKELIHYKNHFKRKVIFLIEVFSYNYNYLGYSKI